MIATLANLCDVSSLRPKSRVSHLHDAEPGAAGVAQHGIVGVVLVLPVLDRIGADSMGRSTSAF
jgi:hypothetical protein